MQPTHSNQDTAYWRRTQENGLSRRDRTLATIGEQQDSHSKTTSQVLEEDYKDREEEEKEKEEYLLGFGKESRKSGIWLLALLSQGGIDCPEVHGLEWEPEEI